MKLTKIVATIGPSSESPAMIEDLIKRGVNIFRFNFKHNSVEWHSETIDKVRTIVKKMGVVIGILIDLQGPEIRIRLGGDEIELKKGVNVPFGGTEFTVSHPQIIPHIKDGQHIVVNDGQFRFTFKIVDGKTYLEPHSSGILKNTKTLNVPGGDFPLPALVERDYLGIKLAAEKQADFIALSFVRSAADVNFLKTEMGKADATSKTISKIETKKAIHNLDEIIEASDAIMIGRGDLGVEIPIEEVPYYQKIMIRKSLEVGSPVITATQMLESMIENPYPTRAEVSDIANAAYDLTDAVMLSAESASGKFPAQAVSLMARTVSFHEQIPVPDVRLEYNFQIRNSEELICDAAYNFYHKSIQDNKVKAFIVVSNTGKTAQMISRYRPQVPIYAVTPSSAVANILTLNFGIYPTVHHEFTEKKGTPITRGDIQKVADDLIALHILQKGDNVVVVHGDTWGGTTGASTIRNLTV
jgi:pyruvate kinase